jgi:azobenzene reductase
MKTRVLLLGGSLNRPSHTGALLRGIADALEARGATADLYDLAQHALPLADPAYHRDPASHPAPEVRELVRRVQDADAIVLASPTYHNAYSGLLKNALDLLAVPQFEGKPVGLAGNAGRQPLTHVVDQLRPVVRGLLGVAIPAQIMTAGPDYVRIDDRYELNSPEITQRIARFADELLWFAERLSRPASGEEPVAVSAAGASR